MGRSRFFVFAAEAEEEEEEVEEEVEVGRGLEAEQGGYCAAVKQEEPGLQKQATQGDERHLGGHEQASTLAKRRRTTSTITVATTTTAMTTRRRATEARGSNPTEGAREKKSSLALFVERRQHRRRSARLASKREEQQTCHKKDAAIKKEEEEEEEEKGIGGGGGKQGNEGEAAAVEEVEKKRNNARGGRDAGKRRGAARHNAQQGAEQDTKAPKRSTESAERGKGQVGRSRGRGRGRSLRERLDKMVPRGRVFKAGRVCAGVRESDALQLKLPDILSDDLKILIVGINPGVWSSARGHHYAGPGNHFWPCLNASGLLPPGIRLSYEDDVNCINYGIGFTNMVSRTTRGMADLSRKEIKEGEQHVRAVVANYKPRVVCFNGKGIYEIFSGKKRCSYGLQTDVDIHKANVFVMPSTSPRGAAFPGWQDKLKFFLELRQLVQDA